MFSYFAYGLGIQSQLYIPEFLPATVKHDVTIKIEKEYLLNDYVPCEVIEHELFIKLDKKKSVFYIKDTGFFLVENGNKIAVFPAPDVSEKVIRLYLVGSVMAILLYQRGLLVLHASAVNINSSAVAFLGVSGQGKSSTAAAFHAHGYDLLTDDVAPVTLTQQTATITPGFPRIKLSREIATALGHDFESLSQLHLDSTKRGYHITQNFAQSPLPIRRIYVLADDTEFGIEPLSPKDSVMELVRHSRPTTIGISGGAPHFLQCATLAKKYNVYRLKRPRNLSLLPELVKLVENHASCQIQSAVV